MNMLTQIYFDHAASSPLYPEVQKELAHAFASDFANPGARHILGQILYEKIENYRQSFLKTLKAAKDDSFIFTSSATESNNTVINGLHYSEGDIILYSPADHPSLTVPVEYLNSEKNILLHAIGLNEDGSINTGSLASLLSDKVRLVVLSHVNNQSGVINDISSIAKLIRQKCKAHIHIDAVQSFGKVKIDYTQDIHSLSIASHKIHGPKGIAGLYLKKGNQLKPLMMGGGQEKGMRSGTESYPLIAAFYQAHIIAFSEMDKALLEVQKLKSKLISGLLEINPKIMLPFSAPASPYILTFVLPGISSDIILRHLETRGVYLSSTSACSSKITGFNKTLHALKIPEKNHKFILRISLCGRSTEDEVGQFLIAFNNVWKELCIHI